MTVKSPALRIACEDNSKLASLNYLSTSWAVYLEISADDDQVNTVPSSLPARRFHALVDFVQNSVALEL